ncbi:MAG: hypothetical protein M3P29_08990, partial [Acidobacteriota bacterium]|nr:hypothetical protein [Acidobacteriota bacterium]
AQLRWAELRAFAVRSAFLLAGFLFRRRMDRCLLNLSKLGAILRPLCGPTPLFDRRTRFVTIDF